MMRCSAFRGIPMFLLLSAGLNTASAVEPLDQTIEGLRQRLEQIEQQLHDLELERKRAAVSATQAPPTGGSVPADKEAERLENERLLSTAFARTLIGHGGLLLSPGVFEVTPGMSYIHSSSDSIVIDGFTIAPVLVVGDIFSQRINRDDYLISAQLRAGLPWESQIGVRVPYGIENERTFEADNTETSSHHAGLGDVQLTLSHQFVHAHGSWPDVMGSVRWKSASGRDPYRADAEGEVALGTGFNSYEASVTAVTVNDPVVFYNTASYTWTPSLDKHIGRVAPGDSYGVQLGMTLALNIDASIYFGYGQSFTRHTRVNGIKVPNSYLSVGTLSTGVNYVLGKDTTLSVNLDIGLTHDAPDLQFDLALPILFGR